MFFDGTIKDASTVSQLTREINGIYNCETFTESLWCTYLAERYKRKKPRYPSIVELTRVEYRSAGVRVHVASSPSL